MTRYMKTRQSIDLLPRNQTIKQFLKKFQIKNQQDIIEEYYLVPTCLTEAYFIIIFCFGGIQTAEKIKSVLVSQNNLQAAQQTMVKFKQILYQCNWDKKSNPTKIFKHNSDIFCKNYDFLYNKILKNIDEQFALQLFKQCCQKSKYLFGARIRQFKKNLESKSRANKRKNQDQENCSISGNIYLIIYQSMNYYIVGSFRTAEEYQTENTMLDDQNQQNNGQVNKRSNSQKSLEVQNFASKSKYKYEAGQAKKQQSKQKSKQGGWRCPCPWF